MNKLFYPLAIVGIFVISHFGYKHLGSDNTLELKKAEEKKQARIKGI